MGRPPIRLKAAIPIPGFGGALAESYSLHFRYYKFVRRQICRTIRGGSMTPIFNRGTDLVGWFDGQHVFDLNMRWIAFESGGHIFSSASSAWLGQLNNGSINDRSGKPVGWLGGSSPQGTLTPLTPLTPLKPLTPLTPLTPLAPLTPPTPLTPLGGWSQKNWQQWLG